MNAGFNNSTVNGGLNNNTHGPNQSKIHLLAAISFSVRCSKMVFFRCDRISVAGDKGHS
jgi:hypothetical protein